MLREVLIICALANCVMNDWVKLPQITNQPKPPYKIQSVTTLADLTSSSSALANSDVLSSVFSYDSSKINTTTITAVPLVTHAPTSSLKKPLMTTVTSKTVNFVHDISDRVDREELMMEPVKLVPTHKESRKVLNMNQTVPMKVSVESGKKLKDTDEDDDDEGVTVLDEDEELVSSEEVEYYYEYEEDAEALTTSTTTTTTRAPRKTTRRPSLTKPTSQRRVSQVPKSKPLLQSSLSFSNFFKFIKNIQSSFTTRTAKNINDKIKMLREFRDSLLLTINQRIKTLWKTQAKTKQNKKQRSKRTLGGGDSGGWMDQGAGMAFPSAEGALLSISFLTFAVFLIKLVLQVIQTIKMKKYAYNNMQMMTSTGDGIQGSSVVLKRHRGARDVHFMSPDDLMATQFHFADHFVHFQPPMFHQNFPKLL